MVGFSESDTKILHTPAWLRVNQLGVLYSYSQVTYILQLAYIKVHFQFCSLARSTHMIYNLLFNRKNNITFIDSHNLILHNQSSCH